MDYKDVNSVSIVEIGDIISVINVSYLFFVQKTVLKDMIFNINDIVML